MPTLASGSRSSPLRVTGAFSAGADVTDLPELWRAIPTVGFQTDKPIIAATSGWVVGGGIVMAMMCDLLVSTEDTPVLLSRSQAGVTAGGISSLAARMPHHRRMEIMLLGSKVPARRGYEVGFVNRVVPNGHARGGSLGDGRRVARTLPRS